MDLFEAIERPRSVRAFQGRPIPREDLFRLDAARWPPTAINFQPWPFAVITDKAMLGRAAQLADYGKFIADALAGGYPAATRCAVRLGRRTFLL